MVKAQNVVNRLAASVHMPFSQQFALEVSWQKVNSQGQEIGEDITDGDDTQQSGSTGGAPSLD